MTGLLYPWALLLLLPIAIWAVLISRGFTAGIAILPGGWAEAVEPALQPSMARHLPQPQRGWQRWSIAGGWVMLVGALAHPVIELEGPPPIANLAGRVIVLDLGAQGVLTEQKLAATTLLARTDLPTAMVAATDDAYTAVPLTMDRNQIQRYLHVLEPGLMPSPGQSLPLALAHAENMLQASGVTAGQVVVITGGRAPSIPKDKVQPRFLRAVIAVDGDTQEWQVTAETLYADSVAPSNLGGLDTALDGEIATKRNQMQGEQRIDLSRWFLLAAALFWLGLFRREESR